MITLPREGKLKRDDASTPHISINPNLDKNTMKTIIDDANLTIPEKDKTSPSNSANQAKLQETARTTVIDGSGRVPQYEGNGYGTVNLKGPARIVHTDADNRNISGGQTL